MTTSSNLFEAYAANRPESIKWYERARRTLAGGVGHDIRHFEPVPLCIEKGLGSRKWDVDGNEYIDFLMGNGSLLLGHSDPDVVAAIQDTVTRGTHFGSDHPLHIEWAELVQSLIPTAERVRFVNSGTEATHLAIRVARAYKRRTKILRFEGHFHGWHDGVVHGFHPPFDADGSLGIPGPVRGQMAMIPDGDANLVDDVLSKDDDIAAVILEPSGGSWGRIVLDPQFLRDVREVTRRHQVPLIFDEVITGFRYSPGGAQQLYDVDPDMTCMAKILAGGMPGGAVAGKEEIMSQFDIIGDAHHDRFERVVHQGTFNAAPLSAAAGIVTLKKVATGEPIERANANAEKLRGAWNDVLERNGIAGYVYGALSTFHVYFETDAERIADASTRANLHTNDARRLKGIPADLVDQYQRYLRHYGVDFMSGTGGVLAAAHSDGDIEESTAAFEKTVSALCDEGLIRRLNG